MKFNWVFTLSVCMSVGVLIASMYAGFESVKASYTQQIADLEELQKVYFPSERGVIRSAYNGNS